MNGPVNGNRMNGNRMGRGSQPEDRDPPGQMTIDLAGVDQLGLLGPRDANLRLLEQRFGGTLTVRGERLLVRGPVESLDLVQEVLEDLIQRVRHGQLVDKVSLGYLWEQRAGRRDLADGQPGDRKSVV